MNQSSIRKWGTTVTLTLACLVIATGCHKPEKWSYTGPRVYLIEGEPGEQSDGLALVRHELAKQEINAKIYHPDDWLKIVVDIDAKPDEEVILVGHGHGGFLATQVVRHYAQCHKMKFIDATFTIDTFNKDWPHNADELDWTDNHTQPMPTPIGHNAIKVRNFAQQNSDSSRWGSDLASTRASNCETKHPYYWYDDYWDRNETVNGQHLREGIKGDDVRHETIDNTAKLVQRIIRLSRRAALSPFHYSPPEHPPDVQRKAKPQQASRTKGKAT
ncbi:MAG: hypothetical protein K8S14_02405 [Actinomycetia bacterium]|nr:hypothetical protein [Actinomycetes bacterium]